MRTSLLAFVACTFLSASAVACSGSSGDGDSSEKDSKNGQTGDDDDDDQAGDDDSSETVTINGEDPDEYYAALTYEKVNRALSGVTTMEKPSGENDAFELNVYLRDDKTFVVYYAEGKSTGVSLSPDEETFRKVEGQWAVKRNLITLGDNFECLGVKFNDEKTMSCIVVKKVVSEGAVGRGPTLLPGAQNAPDDAKFWAAFE